MSVYQIIGKEGKGKDPKIPKSAPVCVVVVEIITLYPVQTGRPPCVCVVVGIITCTIVQQGSF